MNSARDINGDLKDMVAFGKLQKEKELRYKTQILQTLSSNFVRNRLWRELGNLSLGPSDYNRLEDSLWLNDQIVNAYFIVKMMEAKIDLTGILWFSTQFYQSLENAGVAAVLKWTNREDNPWYWNLFNTKYAFFPINFDQRHWVLAVANMTTRQVELYDSKLDTKNATCRKILGNLREFYQAEHRRKCGTDLPSHWKFSLNANAEQQNDDNNCGVYICRYFEVILESLASTGRISDCSTCFTSSRSPAMMRERIMKEVKQSCDGLAFLVFLRVIIPRLNSPFQQLSLKCRKLMQLMLLGR